VRLVILIVGIICACLSVKAAEPLQLNVHNTVTFRGEVSENSVLFYMQELNRLDLERGLKDYPIYLVLDSPGGSVQDGLNFIAYAKTVKNLKTITIFAASMAAVIVEQLQGERLITDTGIIMFHRAKGGVDGQFEDGELESRLNLYKKIIRSLEQVNADRMQISLATYKARIKDELWLFGQDAVLQHANDAVVQLTCTQELVEAGVVQESMMGSILFSNCPLYRTPMPIPDKKEEPQKQPDVPDEASKQCNENNRI
jgi:ATP-dependent protease ClpP protease subunit